MKTIIFFSLLLILSAIMFLPVTTKAQVTIGSNAAPQEFSVLELISSGERGFRLPQLSEYQRDNHLTPMLRESLPDPATNVSPAMGLTIFNTTNKCVETWNGEHWISHCIGETPAPDPCARLANLPNPVAFCSTDRPTIADLTARVREAGGSGTIEWFAAATGGNPLPDNHPLTSTQFYAGNCAGATARTSVPVLLVTNCSLINVNNIRVTTFVNVMYDFQHQTLISFTFTGQATEWQWQVSTTRTGTYTNIPGAISATWTVPVDLVHNPALVGLTSMPTTNELFFRVKMRNPNTPNWVEMPNTNALGILFIPTTVDGQGSNFRPGFGKCEQGVRYLVMNRARNLQIETNPDTIRVALLSLGQSGTGAWYRGERIDIGTPLDDRGRLNDAGDLGDLYQWGRIADGHQHVVWSKVTPGFHALNQITPMTGNGATSAIVAKDAVIADLQINSQGQVGNPEFANRFIAGHGDWGWPHTGPSSPERYDLWGNASIARADAQTWEERAQANNPCPPGWRVPSMHEWSDMHTGDGNNTEGTSNQGYPVLGNNTWNWRGMQNNTDAVGGTLIANKDDELLFLPAAGWRTNTTGAIGNANRDTTNGNYWSSTITFNTPSRRDLAMRLWFSGSNADAGSQDSNRTHAKPVRCVAD